MSLQVNSPRKKNNSSPPRSPPSFLSLPNEIIVTCLARISRSYYPKLSLVSKTLRSLLSSTELYAARSHLKSTEQCLYVCIFSSENQTSQWFRLLINPTSGQLLVPIPSLNFNAMSQSSIVVGSDIYVIGGRVEGKPSSTVRILDCRTHTWRDAPSMNVAREDPDSCFYDGKIYVLGGCKEEDEPWAEVFDLNTKTWEPLPEPGTEIRNLKIHNIQEMEGKITYGYFNNNMYAYDTKQRKWERCENDNTKFMRWECVMENVSYSLLSVSGGWKCQWYDIKDENWKNVKGLDSIRDNYISNGGSAIIIRKLVCCGGKLLLIWEDYMKNSMKICCTEIKVEKRDGGEVWGKIEGVDVVHTVPWFCQLLYCLVVSV